MGEIKRYEPAVEYHELDRGYPSAKMSKDPDGDYVLYTDHQAALAAAQELVKKLEAERDADRRREYGYSQETVDALTAERDALKWLIEVAEYRRQEILKQDEEIAKLKKRVMDLEADMRERVVAE